MGQDDPSKPLLALIIDRLSSGSAPKAATTGIEGTNLSSNARLAKEKESIEAAISDLRKPDDRSKDLIQQAKESPAPAQQGSSIQAAQKEVQAAKETAKEALKESDKQLKAAAEAKKEAPKMMGAKKETETSIGGSLSDKQRKNEKSEDSLPGKKFQNIPDDAMKKNKAAAFDKEDGILL